MDNRKRFRVPLWGKPQGYVAVDPEATKGATLGVDLYRADGSVVTEADLAGAAPAGGSSKVAPTLWQLIQQIPANIKALAALTTSGFVRRAGDGTWSASALQASEAAYDNSTSGMTAADVQAAIDELSTTVGGGSWKTVIKSADESRASTTVRTADSELQITLPAGLYFVEADVFLNVASGSNANHGVEVSTIGGNENLLGFRRRNKVSSASGTGNEQTQSGIGPNGVALAAAGIMPGAYGVVAAIELTASDTIAVKWAQNSSSSTASMVLRGSALRVTRG